MFKKGRQKTGGKIRGSQDSKTVLVNSFINHAIEGGADKFRDELMKLEGKNYVDAYLRLLEYVAPKLQRTQLVASVEEETKQQFIVGDQILVF
jgi:hypothetical protein